MFCKKGVLRNFAKFTGKHLSQSPFFNKVAALTREFFGYNEIRVIFDRYIKKLVKTQTRIGKTGAYSTVYRVHDKIKTGYLETKEFLSSIETKNDLTVFLNNKVASASSERSIRCVTVYSTACDINIPDVDPALSQSRGSTCNYCFTRN